MQVINDAKRCVIQVSCKVEDFALNDTTQITSVQIRRIEKGQMTLIGQVAVNSQEDLNFTFLDFYTRCGRTYQYMCAPIIDGSVGLSALSEEVTCVFSDVFIGNLSEQYVCAIDAKYQSTLNFNMNYVQTIHAAYPHAVSNGNQQYYTGSFSGIFLEMGDDCQFIKEYSSAGLYREKVKRFLANKVPKVIKTKEGDLWCVQINGAIRDEYGEYPGIAALSFDWTEIKAPPTYGIVVIAND